MTRAIRRAPRDAEAATLGRLFDDVTKGDGFRAALEVTDDPQCGPLGGVM